MDSSLRPTVVPARLAPMVIASLLLASCLELPAGPPARDAAAGLDAAPPALHVASIVVLDARGAPRPLDAIPRSPRVRVETSAPLGGDDDESVVLVAGISEASLVADLEGAPLRAETLARVIACAREQEGATLVLTPLAPLEPGAALHVAVASWARDASGRRLGTPFVQALRVDPSERGGARALETWPPDGASGVAPALPLAAVRFDGAVSGIERGLWLEGPDGARIPGDARAARCDEIGWAGEHCAVFVPARALAPGALHAIRSDARLLDATGAPVPALHARFETALEPDLDPPGWIPPACARDELASESACVLADDARVVLRVRASEPVRLRLSGAGTVVRAVAPRGEAELALEGLGPSARVPALLEAIDLAGHLTRVELELATTEPLAPISITEVRADPFGSEPRQEYVELANLGASAIELEGFTLADAPGAEGDAFSGAHRIAPGARVLVVAEGFDPDDRGDGDRDVAIPPGVPLLRLDRSLASGGLSNSGEPLFLRDPLGRRVSAAPAEPAPRQGVCTVRVADDPRTGARGSFDYDAEGGCTPGR